MKFSISKLLVISLSSAAFLSDSAFADATPDCGAAAQVRTSDVPCIQKVLKSCQQNAQALGSARCTALQTAWTAEAPGGSTMITAGTSIQGIGAQEQAMADGCGKAANEACKRECTDTQTQLKCADALHEQQSDFQTLAQSDVQNGSSFSKVGTASQDSNPKDQTTNGSTTTGGSATKPATAAGGSGSGSGMNMGSMAQMGMMAGMMGMAMSQNSDKDSDATPTLANNSALQANGTVLCDKADSGLYAACNSYLAQACLQAIQGNTYAASPTCTNFGARYCTGGDGITTDTQTTATLSTGTTMPMLGVQGAGSKTAFCQTAVAYNYCSDGMHGACPACQNLGNVTSLSCANNPAGCIAQSSNVATVTGLPAICSDDPMVQAAGGPAAIPAPIAATAPAVGGIAAPATSTLGVQTVLPQSASGLVVYRDPAAVKPSSVGTPGPASDVGAEYGPSLGSITASAIQSRCQSGQLNCP